MEQSCFVVKEMPLKGRARWTWVTSSSADSPTVPLLLLFKVCNFSADTKNKPRAGKKNKSLTSKSALRRWKEHWLNSCSTRDLRIFRLHRDPRATPRHGIRNYTAGSGILIKSRCIMQIETPQVTLTSLSLFPVLYAKSKRLAWACCDNPLFQKSWYINSRYLLHLFFKLCTLISTLITSK